MVTTLLRNRITPQWSLQKASILFPATGLAALVRDQIFFISNTFLLYATARYLYTFFVYMVKYKPTYLDVANEKTEAGVIVRLLAHFLLKQLSPREYSYYSWIIFL